MSANRKVVAHWLLLAWVKVFPWRLSFKVRRFIGAAGMLWGMGQLWAVGVIMGAGEWSWFYNFNLLANLGVVALLLWQTPIRPCLQCGLNPRTESGL